MASIIFDSGPRTGETILLDRDKITFGRNRSCDCVLNHPIVSREHFYIERNNGKYFLVDQKSNNGTFANDKPVSWVQLKDGDKIQAGPFTMIVELTDVDNESGRAGLSASEDLRSHSERLGFDASHEKVYPREYLEGIEHFNSRRYFEAHESWEEIWLRSSGETKIFLQMLIQAAVGLHHYERGNHRGARGMYKAVTEKLPRVPEIFMSLDTKDFSRRFKGFLADLIEDQNEAPPEPDRPRPFINLLRQDSAEVDLTSHR